MQARSGFLGGATALGAGLALVGCAIPPPTAPTVMALPPPGKSFAQFQQEDYQCRAYAQQETSYAAAAANQTNPTANGAIFGTLAGAALGAGLGAVAGNAGAGAAIGGATGLLGGSAVGANRAAGSEYSLQQQYNIYYTQCMYAHGNSVRSPPPGYFGAAYPAPFPYPYPYSGPYAYAPGLIGGGFVVGGGWGPHWGGGRYWGGRWH